MTMTDQAALLARLERRHFGGISTYHVNPDGPAAAALIRSMQERIEMLEGERDEARETGHESFKLAVYHQERADTATRRITALEEALEKIAAIAPVTALEKRMRRAAAKALQGER